MKTNHVLALALAAALGLPLVGVSSTPALAKGRIGASIDFSHRRFHVKGAFGSRSRIRRHRRHRHSTSCPVVRQPGYWNRESVPVWKAGHYETVHVPARYETRYDSCGNPYQVLVAAACTRRIFVRPRRVYEQRKIWIAPTTVYRCGY